MGDDIAELVTKDVRTRGRSREQDILEGWMKVTANYAHGRKYDVELTRL